MSPEVIPYLVEKLQYRDPPAKRFCRAVWKVLPIPPARRLKWIQPVPEDMVRRNAKGLLRLSKYYGKALVPALVNEYTKNGAEVRIVLAEILGEIGADARPAVPTLRESVSSRNAEESRVAVAALQKIEQAP